MLTMVADPRSMVVIIILVADRIQGHTSEEWLEALENIKQFGSSSQKEREKTRKGQADLESTWSDPHV